MSGRLSHFRCLALALALALGASAPAWSMQGAPPNIPADISGAQSLTPAQKETLNAYVGYWSERLTNEDPLVIAEARNQLIRPLQVLAKSGAFQVAYGGLLAEKITPMLKGPSDIAATNGLVALRFAELPETADLFIEQMSPRTQPREARRQSAAANLAEMLPHVTFVGAKATSVGRALSSAILEETVPTVLERGLQAMNVLARRNAGVMPVQIETLRGLVTKIDRQTSPSELMAALSNSIPGLRDQFLAMPVNQQRESAPLLQPVILSLLQTVQKHWELAQEDMKLQAAYGNAVQRGETLLRLLARDGSSAPPAAVLHEAWKSNDRPKFEAAIKTWEAAVKRN
jgi:hypothetical protein